jgi:hypothetical protein
MVVVSVILILCICRTEIKFVNVNKNRPFKINIKVTIHSMSLSYISIESFIIVMFLVKKILYAYVCFQLFSGDGLPAQVCRQCVRLVNTSYKFKQQCESSDTALRQYLSSQPYTVNVSVIMAHLDILHCLVVTKIYVL